MQMSRNAHGVFSLTRLPCPRYGRRRLLSLAHAQGIAVPRLTVIKGTDEGKLFELTAEQVTVGRDATNKVRLHDTEVSRRHAEFVRTPEGYRLRDLNSV